MNPSLPPTIYIAKSANAAPLFLMVFAILLVGGALIYRAWRVSGGVSIWLVGGTVAVLGLGLIVWTKVQGPAESVTIYPDRIVTASGVIRMQIVTGVHIQSDVSMGNVAGRPVANSRRVLIADTIEGEKIIARDDLFNIDEIQNSIREAGTRVP
jgi:hypothetical protein